MPQQEQNATLHRLQAHRQALLREMAAVDKKIRQVEQGMIQLDAQILNISQAKPTGNRRRAA